MERVLAEFGDRDYDNEEELLALEEEVRLTDLR